MEMFTARVTADAKVSTLKDKRQVVNFSVAINDYYKARNSEEGKKVVTYINCSYRISTNIAERLTKGAVVEIVGRMFTTAYVSGNDAKASLNCHVKLIKILHSVKKAIAFAEPATVSDDLPF
jgi:single-strand DNA-binding protein